MADVTLIRSEPSLYGRVASDPTVSRLVGRLAQDAGPALRAINGVRASAQAWALASGCSTRSAGPCPVTPAN